MSDRGDRVADLSFTCEAGHHVIAKRGVPITSDTTCPAPVYRDGEIALYNKTPGDDPFGNPAVQPCGADVDTVDIDIYDYEAGRYT